ncbi:hypothetical protein Nepgr_028526 [Nepenthes gracilis]|uniref:Uncharacterized protein n=1 Tax=Nepenthes gracilis TaxID=150966 RepID=A0AAD3Y2H7_NEPGR|nr:hypothetical protein Nepgr_028526 [Nepenthes gracilis]
MGHLDDQGLVRQLLGRSDDRGFQPLVGHLDDQGFRPLMDHLDDQGFRPLMGHLDDQALQVGCVPRSWDQLSVLVPELVRSVAQDGGNKEMSLPVGRELVSTSQLACGLDAS